MRTIIFTVEKGFDRVLAACFLARMPPRRTAQAEPGGLHKTTINFPTELYEDLRLLAALESGGSMNALLERAARDLVERERETLVQMRKLAAKREAQARAR